MSRKYHVLGDVATSTAIFSTGMILPAGSQRTPAGDFWAQMDAVLSSRRIPKELNSAI